VRPCSKLLARGCSRYSRKMNTRTAGRFAGSWADVSRMATSRATARIWWTGLMAAVTAPILRNASPTLRDTASKRVFS
jgi:hypothetical protein